MALTERGTLYQRFASKSWPVTYALTVREGTPPSLTGWVQLDVNATVQTGNADAPIYLRLQDGQWALLMLADAPSSGANAYIIGPRSHLSDRPSWASDAEGGA